MTVPTLTKQQKRAMRAFLWSWGSEGFDGQACDGAVWDEGVRPWPTMRNLERKGLVQVVGAWRENEGYTYELTSVGAEFMRAIATPRIPS